MAAGDITQETLQQTARLDLYLPGYDESADIEFPNRNFDQLDKSVGITSVNKLADITDPQKQQFAFETSTNKLFFWTPEVHYWTLIAIGDPTSPNPDRIVIPAKSEYDVTLTSTENPLQLGLDGGVNMAFDSNEIQGRDGQGGPNPVYINNNGGHVVLGGPDKGLVEGDAGGISIPSMVPRMKNDNNNLTPTSSWTSVGIPNQPQCYVEQICHYSGRFLVMVCVTGKAVNATDYGECTYGVSGGATLDPSEDAERMSKWSGAATSRAVITHLYSAPISGAGNARGKKLKFMVYMRRNSASADITVLDRTITVIPLY